MIKLMVLKYQKLNPNMVVTPQNLANQLSVNVSRYNRMNPGVTHSTLSPLELSVWINSCFRESVLSQIIVSLNSLLFADSDW